MAITTTNTTQATPTADQIQKQTEKSDTGNFLALLNIGRVSAENNAAPTATQSIQQASRPSTRQEPEPLPPQQTSRFQQKPQQDGQTAQPNSASIERDKQPEPPSTHAKNTTIQKKPNNDAKGDNDSPSLPIKTDKKSATAPTSEEESIADRQKKVREQLDDQLSSIAQILQALIEALSAAKPAEKADGLLEQPEIQIALSPPQTAAATDIASQLASLVQTEPQPETTAKIEIPTELLATNIEEDINLLKDIQSLLQQLKDTLKAVDNTEKTIVAPTATTTNIYTQTPDTTQENPATTQAKTLENLIVNVQQDVAALGQRLTLPKNESATITFTTADTSTQTVETVVGQISTTPETGKPQSIITYLKNSIAEVRERLQSLQSDNENIYSQSKATLQQQFELAQTNFRQNQLQATTLTTTDTAKITEAALPSVTTVATTTIASPTFQVTQQPIVPISIVATQTETTNDAGQQSNQQGQNSSQQQTSAITPTSSGQISNTDISRTETPNFARAITRNQQLPLSEQVAYQVKTAISDGTSKIRIQLDPADLGKMDIKLTVEANGKTGISILVDNKSTLDLLQRDTAALTRALNEAGLSADSSSLNFNLRGGQQQNQQNNQQASHTYQKALPSEEEIPLQNIINRNYVVNVSDGLDIKI